MREANLIGVVRAAAGGGVGCEIELRGVEGLAEVRSRNGEKENLGNILLSVPPRCDRREIHTTGIISGVLNVTAYRSGVSPAAETCLYPESTSVGRPANSSSVNSILPYVHCEIEVVLGVVRDTHLLLIEVFRELETCL